ncbi:IS110 family transposase [Mycolicibacterium sp. Y3]
MTILGIDSHKRTHTIVAVDPGGAKLAEKTVDTTSAGHAAALDWAQQQFGADITWGVEDQRAVTHLLERELLAAHQTVKRVPPHLMARHRGSARTWGKSDPIDALAVARAVLREPNLPAAVHDYLAWELKLMIDRREDLVGQRVNTTNRLHGRLHLLAPEQAKIAHLERENPQQALAEYLKHQPGLVAEMAREELADLQHFTRQITAVTKQLRARVQELESSLLSIPGCAELTAAKLIAEAANMDRFRSEAAFARYTGVAPLPLSSGSTTGRVRLSRSGNRACNAAIHRIAIVQIRLNGPGRAYYERRRSQGDTYGMAMRTLKRRLCRIIYNRLCADYAARPHQAPKALTSAVNSGLPAWMLLTQLSQFDDGYEDE